MCSSFCLIRESYFTLRVKLDEFDLYILLWSLTWFTKKAYFAPHQEIFYVHVSFQCIVQIETLGEFGVFFILFVLGLEFSLEKIKQVCAKLYSCFRGQNKKSNIFCFVKCIMKSVKILKGCFCLLYFLAVWTKPIYSWTYGRQLM